MRPHSTRRSRGASAASTTDELSFRLTYALAGCRKGDDEAWQAFNDLFGVLARRALRTFRLTPIEFEEVGSAVRINLLQALISGRFDHMDGDPIKYMCGALRNGARDALRRRRSQCIVPPVESPQPSPADVAEFNEQARHVQATLETWNAVDRSLFIAKIGGVPSAMIKEQLERDFNLCLSIGAVDVRFSRLRGMLRTQCR